MAFGFGESCGFRCAAPAINEFVEQTDRGVEPAGDAARGGEAVKVIPQSTLAQYYPS
jgi:acetaldehyde dehydrogenase (acetylating)